MTHPLSWACLMHFVTPYLSVQINYEDTAISVMNQSDQSKNVHCLYAGFALSDLEYCYVTSLSEVSALNGYNQG